MKGQVPRPSIAHVSCRQARTGLASAGGPIMLRFVLPGWECEPFELEVSAA